jgi:hypothetical protein
MAKKYTIFIFIIAVLLSLPSGTFAQAEDAAPPIESAAGAKASASASVEAGDLLRSPDLAKEPPADVSPGSSEAYTEEDPIEKRAHIGLIIGPKLGANFSGVFSDLGTSFITELEIGYLLPLPKPVGRSFELFVTGQYTQPTVDGKTTEKDPRLPGNGIMKYDITQQELILTLGLLYRIPLGGEVGQWLRPYMALGGRLYLMKTLVDGSAGGQPFGENEETATRGGFYSALGGDVFVGPGSVFLEAQVVYASLDGFVMRDTNVGALNLAVGYRLFL